MKRKLKFLYNFSLSAEESLKILQFEITKRQAPTETRKTLGRNLYSIHTFTLLYMAVENSSQTKSSLLQSGPVITKWYILTVKILLLCKATPPL